MLWIILAAFGVLVSFVIGFGTGVSVGRTTERSICLKLIEQYEADDAIWYRKGPISGRIRKFGWTPHSSRISGANVPN